MPTPSFLSRRWVLATWTLAVAVLLLVPTGDELPEGGAWDWLDKPVHTLLFAMHCGLLALWLGSSLPAGRAVLVAFLASGLYALLLEALQILVPGRYFEWWDVVADLAGTTLAALILARPRARLRGTS